MSCARFAARSRARRNSGSSDSRVGVASDGLTKAPPVVWARVFVIREDFRNRWLSTGGSHLLLANSGRTPGAGYAARDDGRGKRPSRFLGEVRSGVVNKIARLENVHRWGRSPSLPVPSHVGEAADVSYS